MTTNDPKVTPNWRPSDTQVTPKWHPSDTQATTEWHPNDTQVTPNSRTNRAKSFPPISYLRLYFLGTGIPGSNYLCYPAPKWHASDYQVTPKWHPMMPKWHLSAKELFLSFPIVVLHAVFKWCQVVSKLYQVMPMCCICISQVVQSGFNFCHHVATRCAYLYMLFLRTGVIWKSGHVGSVIGWAG